MKEKKPTHPPTLILLPSTITCTSAGLVFYNHVIPLVSKFVERSKTHVTLSRTVSSGQDITEKRKFSVPLLNNHDVETICHCILEFRDVCHATRLSLTQGPLKFTYFRQCLDGITHDDWDLITAYSNQTNDRFHQATTELLMQNIKPTDLADQEHYIRHCKKPFKYNCHELSSHLQFMNKMMRLFPGANDTPPFNHQELKNIYFKMMPDEWQHAFINNGQDIASHHYTLLKLQQYMGTLETLRRALTQARHSHHNQSCNQNQNENTSNNCQIEENNNGSYHQCFRPQNSHNGNTRHFQYHPYYRNPTNNNNQATSNNQGQQPECNCLDGQTNLPPSAPPPKHPTSQRPKDMYYANNDNQHPYEDENEFHQDPFDLDDSNHHQNHENPNHQSLIDQPDLTNNEQTNNNNEYDDYDNLSSSDS